MTTDAGLRKIFQDNLRGFHWTSVETGGTGRGIPDAEYCCDGRTGWIENKKVYGWRVRIQPEQVAWIEQRARYGGVIWVACRKPGARGGLWLFKPAAARLLQTTGVHNVAPALLAGHWPGQPARWDWQAIAGLLTGRK